jgi:hypothetical protein
MKKFYCINRIDNVVPSWENEPTKFQKPDYLYLELNAQSDTNKKPTKLTLFFSMAQMEHLNNFLNANLKKSKKSKK